MNPSKGLECAGESHTHFRNSLLSALSAPVLKRKRAQASGVKPLRALSTVSKPVECEISQNLMSGCSVAISMTRITRPYASERRCRSRSAWVFHHSSSRRTWRSRRSWYISHPRHPGLTRVCSTSETSPPCRARAAFRGGSIPPHPHREPEILAACPRLTGFHQVLRSSGFPPAVVGASASTRARSRRTRLGGTRNELAGALSITAKKAKAKRQSQIT